ncbi:hypothetical protein [Marinomonas balearica]|uniref:Uncharacterized protein n=1 Tax=Marinomonas balearica TaxID=491947 RepID=A0A4R6MBH7_9GAMM|nr:hypothetical protein [Marinomonas balearica]TDO98958.1 hypothetical protein DFP79_1382 [Marinomonas balearica]
MKGWKLLLAKSAYEYPAKTCAVLFFSNLLAFFQHIDISVATGSFFGLKDSWCRVAPQSVETNN